jgi:serine/threonine-protein kinase RsbW
MSISEKKILSFPSNTKHLPLIEPFLAEVLAPFEMDATRYHNTMIALTEAVNNAIIHGNKRDESKVVILTAFVEVPDADEPSTAAQDNHRSIQASSAASNATLTIILDDFGSGFNPEALPDPLAPENLLRSGGRGVFLMRSLMDSAEFTRTESGTRTTLRIRLQE